MKIIGKHIKQLEKEILLLQEYEQTLEKTSFDIEQLHPTEKFSLNCHEQKPEKARSEL